MHVDRTRFLMLTSALAAACARSPGVASGGRPPPTESGESAQPGEVEVPEAAEEVEPEESPAPASGCDDMVGTPARCADMRLPGPTCEQGMNVPPNVCDAIKRVAKPRIAEALTSCLVSRSKEGGACGPDDWVGDCAERALDKVCSLDRSHERECREIESRCSRYRHGSKAVTTDACVRLVSGVLPSEQRAALTCVSEGCGVDYCFVSLAYGKTY
jgi:hypothetical protein